MPRPHRRNAGDVPMRRRRSTVEHLPETRLSRRCAARASRWGRPLSIASCRSRVCLCLRTQTHLERPCGPPPKRAKSSRRIVATRSDRSRITQGPAKWAFRSPRLASRSGVARDIRVVDRLFTAGWGQATTLNLSGRAARITVGRATRGLLRISGLAGLPVRPLDSRPTGSTPVSSTTNNTSGPEGPKMPARKRPEKTKPTPPEQDVRELQDAEHVEADFLRDLDRAATDRSAEKLAKASRPDPASPKT